MSRALRSMLAVGTAAAMGLSLSACSLLPFGNQTHSTSLKVGQCIQLPDDDEVGDITTANCAEEHTGEVYYILTLTQDTLPSRAEIEKLTSDTCDDNFEAYVGSATNETELDVTAMFPTKNSWDKGDRDIVCIVIPAEGKTLTQSVKGSGMTSARPMLFWGGARPVSRAPPVFPNDGPRCYSVDRTTVGLRTSTPGLAIPSLLRFRQFKENHVPLSALRTRFGHRRHHGPDAVRLLVTVWLAHAEHQAHGRTMCPCSDRHPGGLGDHDRVHRGTHRRNLLNHRH